MVKRLYINKIFCQGVRQVHWKLRNPIPFFDSYWSYDIMHISIWKLLRHFNIILSLGSTIWDSVIRKSILYQFVLFHGNWAFFDRIWELIFLFHKEHKSDPNEWNFTGGPRQSTLNSRKVVPIFPVCFSFFSNKICPIHSTNGNPLIHFTNIYWTCIR